MTIHKIELRTTDKDQWISLDRELENFIQSQKINHGVLFIYCPHTTAAISINENADPNVIKDLILGLSKISPYRKEYLHFEGNSDAHLKSSLVGASETVFVEEGKLVLGTWQSVYFCEFDGPRSRSVYIKVLHERGQKAIEDL